MNVTDITRSVRPAIGSVLTYLGSTYGKDWVLPPNAACASILLYGGQNDGAGDNVAPLLAALADNKCVMFPPGRYYFSGPVNFTMPNDTWGVELHGSGSGSTFLVFAPGDGINLTFKGQKCSAQVSGLTFCATGVNQGTGLKFTQTGPDKATGTYPAASQLSDVFFRGDQADAASGEYPGPQYWANGFYTNYVSNITFINVNVFGGRTPQPAVQGIGINLGGAATPGIVSFVYNIIGGNFFQLGSGLLYGANIQGVAVNTANYVGCTYGIYVPLAAPNNTAQLTVIGSQFGYNTIGIYDNMAVGSEIFTSNVFFCSNPGNIGIRLGKTGSFTISANAFQGLTKSGPTIGILLDANLGNGVIVDNQISNLGVGVQLSTGIVNVQVANNNFTANTNPLISAVTNNLVAITGVGQDNPVSYTQVLGFASNGATPTPLVRLQVQSTAGFHNGMLVLLGGIDGLTGIRPTQHLVAPIAVIDGTHMDVLTMIWSGGTYVGGTGAITSLP